MNVTDKIFWFVMNPKSNSCMEDICFSATFYDYACIYAGSNTAENYTIYDEKEEAEKDAKSRLEALYEIQNRL